MRCWSCDSDADTYERPHREALRSGPSYCRCPCPACPTPRSPPRYASTATQRETSSRCSAAGCGTACGGWEPPPGTPRNRPASSSPECPESPAAGKGTSSEQWERETLQAQKLPGPEAAVLKVIEGIWTHLTGANERSPLRFPHRPDSPRRSPRWMCSQSRKSSPSCCPWTRKQNRRHRPQFDFRREECIDPV